MKKTIIAIIGLAMVGTVLIGCGSEAVAPDTQQTKQEGKTPDGKSAGGAAEIPAK